MRLKLSMYGVHIVALFVLGGGQISCEGDPASNRSDANRQSDSSGLGDTTSQLDDSTANRDSDGNVIPPPNEETDSEDPYVPGSSRLDNITVSCGNAMPNPVSGGSNGWGSRYWDCCKPHCSWPENTDDYAANCDVDNAEIPCFQEVGDQYYTGYEGTKSGCEADGEAFMCYSHVPFAVCDNLAYGFAAVPASGDSCGSCYQLDFDGGFEHGEAKPAHRLMAGKTMIVMASNIGHDVGGGQFDIMIPGGGLGAFKDGCAKQWNVDVNNPSLVGKVYGGFTSTCQEDLGWDAAPETIKTCVRGMCDALFGDKPNLKDLWEGCIWYVDWMHAVDNPTFTYKEVPCPTELQDLYYSSFH